MADPTQNGRGDSVQYEEEHISHDLPEGHPDKPVISRCVLIAVDNSTVAERAFEWYADNIHKPENHVIVFSVAEPPNMQAVVGFGAGFAFPVEEWQTAIEERKKECRELQMKFADGMRKKGLHGKVTVYWSDSPGTGIISYIKMSNATKERVPIDMVIMGSRGLGKLRRTFMGSVSSYVLHHCHLPVIVVPPEKKQGHA